VFVQSEKAKAVRFKTSVEQEKKPRVGGKGADRTEVTGQIATGERGWSGGREELEAQEVAEKEMSKTPCEWS
jgi:hypothetical protein